METIKEAVKAVEAFRPADVAASAGGLTIDRLGFDDALFVLSTGAVDGTSPTLDVKIQESDDGSTWSDVSGATFTQITAANQLATLRVNLAIGRKRYLRIYSTIGGTDTPKVATAVLCLLGKPETKPVTNEDA